MKVLHSTALGGAIAALILAAGVSGAQAADMTVVEKSPVGKCYFGLVGGYGFGEASIQADLAGAPLSEDGKGDLGGGMIGGLVGCDLYAGNGLVLGLAGDLSWANVGGNFDLDDNGSPLGYKADVDVNWLGTARARIGYEFGDALIYGTGGLAVAGVGVNLGLDGAGNIGSDSTTQYGWTIGVGLNYMLNDHVMLGAEYLYADFGKTDFDFGSHGKADGELDMHIIRGTIGYRF